MVHAFSPCRGCPGVGFSPLTLSLVKAFYVYFKFHEVVVSWVNRCPREKFELYCMHVVVFPLHEAPSQHENEFKLCTGGRPKYEDTGTALLHSGSENSTRLHFFPFRSWNQTKAEPSNG